MFCESNLISLIKALSDPIMKFNINLHEFKKKREQELMSNRQGRSIFTRIDSKHDDFYTH